MVGFFLLLLFVCLFLVTYNEKGLGNSLVVQWLGLHTSTAGARVQSLVRELRSHKPCSAAKGEKKGLKLYRDNAFDFGHVKMFFDF